MKTFINTCAMMWNIATVFALFIGGILADVSIQTPSSVDDNKTCDYEIWHQSVTFYESRLISVKPNFIHFGLELNQSCNIKSDVLKPLNWESCNSTSDVFKPLNWVWSYKSPVANYPYLSWNIDHGILSFGLLDVKTANIPFVKLLIPPNCSVTFGSEDTTYRVVKALKSLIINMSDNSYHKYEESFFCYLAVAPGIKERSEYIAALYLNYPIPYLNYNCCRLEYSYVNTTYSQDCTIKQKEKWIQCTLGPYILGLVIFMYFPIVLLEICAWISKGYKVIRHDVELLNTTREEYESLTIDDSGWIYLDGKPPLTLLGSFNFIWCGLERNHPVAVSRIRRIICIFLAPSVIFIQLVMYKDGIGSGTTKITVPELIEKGTPMGFLALLGERRYQRESFAPLFGGPMCLLIMYYILGVVFLVFPRSLKQIVERGMPSSNISSPLFLHVDEIIKLSMLSISPEAGYENGAAVCRCSIYMIFNKMFWFRVFEIQRERFHLNQNDQSRLPSCLKYVLLPFYVLLCLAEAILCVIFYGIPVFGFITIMVKGAVKSFFMFRLQNRCVSIIFRNIFTVCLGTLVVLVSFLFFFYAVCLIFVQSFSFLSQILIFCFVAVIVYPSVSFGYLFFFVVLLYYIVRLFKDFGDGYLELLSIAVEKSHDMYSQINHLSVFNGELILSNLQAQQVKGIRINDQLLDIPQNVLQRLESKTQEKKIAEKDNVYGIPERLFKLLVQVHRPVHIQVLKILLQFAFVVLLVVITMSITTKFASGATSEISDVMHVVFIVTVGALPRVLEVALMNSSETVKREIELRRIEQTIREFWELEAAGGFTFEQ